MLETKFPEKYVVWDLETSGLTPGQDRILEIGAMMVQNGEIAGTFNALINNGIEISPEITQITGLTKEKLEAEGKDPAETLEAFFKILEEYPASITHNGFRFDVPFLIAALKSRGPFDSFRIEALEKKLRWCHCDTAVLYKAKKLGAVRGWNEPFDIFARRVMDQRVYGLKYNVGIACDELGIDRSTIQQHRAGGDVELTHEIFKKLTSASR